MIGLLLKDFYTLRQYGKTMLLMLVFFAIMGLTMDNPATFFEGFIIVLSMMMAITSFSYDSLAKWDRYALSLPITRREVVASKYLLSLILCLAGAIISFLLSAVVLQLKSVEGFDMMDHFYVTVGIIAAAVFFSSILLPLTFKFGVEKSRIFLIVIFAASMAGLLVMGNLGIPMPTESDIMTFVKFLPIIIAILYFLSYILSIKLFNRKEF